MSKSTSAKVQPSRKNSSKSYIPWIAIAFILLITAILYLPSLKNDFVNWDDNVYVTENESIKKFDSRTVSYFFDTEHPVSLNYHPLTMISLAWDYNRAANHEKASKDKPFPGLTAYYYHQTNLFLHLINTTLVFFLIYFMSGKRWLVALITALLFGIHPLHVESVAWISERKDVLYAAFYLAALLAYWKYLDYLKWPWLLLTFALFTLSLLSKGLAVSLPISLLLLDYFKGRTWNWRIWAEKIPFLALSIYFGLLAIEIQSKGAIAQEGAVTLFQRIVFASYGFIMYLYKLILPLKLSTFYPYPHLNDAGTIPGYFYIFPALVVILIGILAYFFRKNKVVLFGFGFYLITIALVLQFLPVGKALMADRYSYLPFIGIAFMIGYGIDRIREREKLLKVSLLAGMAVFFVFWGVQTSAQIKVWQNPETLWTQAISNYPNAFVAYKNRGNYYGQNGKTDLAMQDYLYLQSRGEMDSQVYGNMGNIYRMRNEMDKAFESYQMQVKLDEEDYKGHINVGIMHSIRNEHEAAIRKYQDAIDRGAPANSVILNRGISLNSMQRYAEAIQDFTNFLSYNPYNLDAYRNRGLSYFQLKEYDKAIADFEKGKNLAPQDGGWAYNLAICYLTAGDKSKAIAYTREAQQAGYQIPAALLEALK